MQETRKGTTVYQYISLKDILDIDRLCYEKLESIFDFISEVNKNEIIKLPKEELLKMIFSNIKKKKK